MTVTDPDANVVTYAYDTSGQRTGMTLTVDGADVMDLDYTNTNGRLTEIADAAGPTFYYSYLASSNLIETLVHANATDDVLTATRTYDDADRLLSISSSSLKSTLHDAPQQDLSTEWVLRGLVAAVSAYVWLIL